MPQRPRSHELEDLSLDRLNALRPAGWVSRRKPSDYGVDIEFEIFSGGRSTGLLLYAQVRATDSAERARRLALDLEQLDYFDSLDVPTIVVRYAAAEDAFYWRWSARLRDGATPSEGQRTITVGFGDRDRWREETPDEIVAALTASRTARTLHPAQPIGIRADLSALAAGDRYAAARAIEEAASGTDGALVPDRGGATALTIDADVSDDAVRISAGPLFEPLRVARTGRGAAPLASAVLHLAAVALGRIGLRDHARRTARAALATGVPVGDRGLAAHAALALLDDPHTAVRLALLNGLHADHDVAHLIFLAGLAQNGGADSPAAKGAQSAFLAAAVSEAAIDAPERAGPIHYTAGNLLREVDPLAAVGHYKAAARLRPAYARSDYFLRELGSCLFGVRRYRCAALCYSNAMASGGEPIDHCHLGDALLLSGRIDGALDAYGAAAYTDDPLLSSEILVKAETCRWLRRQVGSGTARADRAAADRSLDGNFEEPARLERVIRDIDATHELAHFNLAVHRAATGRWSEALPGFLLCAIKRSGDVEAWSNAAICCLRLDDPASFLLDLLATAISLAGLRTYDDLRDRLLEQDAHASLIEAMDRVAGELASLRAAPGRGGITVRLLSG